MTVDPVETLALMLFSGGAYATSSPMDQHRELARAIAAPTTLPLCKVDIISSRSL